MKRKLSLIFTIFFIITKINAQIDYYYYFNNNKIRVQVDKQNLNLYCDMSFDIASLQNLNGMISTAGVLSCNPNEDEGRIIKVNFTTILSDFDYLQKINFFKNLNGVNVVSKFYKKSENSSIGTSQICYVKLKQSSDLSILTQQANLKKFTILQNNRFMPLWYKISTNKSTIENSVELTNYLQETGLFDNVDPAFIFDFKISSKVDPPCVNDYYFYEQWGLQNNVNPAIDVNACDAWSITQGQGINIAIIDTGIDKTHNDLTANMHPNSFDTCFAGGSSPSQFYFPHATWVAGISSAIKDNNEFIAGIAPQSKLIDVSNKFANSINQSEQLANGINWAWQNGADIINNSWGDQAGQYYSNLHSAILEQSISNALTFGRNGLGCIVVFSSGNHTVIDYPAYVNPDIICVGGITSQGNRFNNGGVSYFSGYGPQLDVVAPGENITSTAGGNDVDGGLIGTSLSAPLVSGIAALILSVNPCLSQKQVARIIEKTSQKVGNYSYSSDISKPNGSWNNEMGYGLVDAYAAVQLAQAMNSSSLDLMVADGTTDFGIEPNTTSQSSWDSPDIWVRNQNDGLQIKEHQNPKYYVNGNLNYIYVRITNKSCVASFGNGTDNLKLYFALDGLWYSWPNSWSSILPTSQYVIPIIEPGQEVILTIPWLVPNPNSFPKNKWTVDGGNSFALLTRIVSNDDPMTFVESIGGKNHFFRNVLNNNNIAFKNLLVINIATLNKAIINLNNLTTEVQNSYLEIYTETTEIGKPIYEASEIAIKMDDQFYNAWQVGGEINEQLLTTADAKKRIVSGNHVILDNITLSPNQKSSVLVDFNFLIDEATDKNKFTYYIVQKDKLTGQILGGSTFIIQKENRPSFTANAGENIVIDKNEPLIITAAQISEPAIYNWYDESGVLIFTGKDLNIATNIEKKFKLEVIATTDGFKDYDEVNVKFKPSSLSIIAPNPASSNVTIGYKLNNATSAYLMIIGGYSADYTSNNYILNLENSNTTIDISSFINGFYTIALVCNGQIVHAKTLIKN